MWFSFFENVFILRHILVKFHFKVDSSSNYFLMMKNGGKKSVAFTEWQHTIFVFNTIFWFNRYFSTIHRFSESITDLPMNNKKVSQKCSFDRHFCDIYRQICYLSLYLPNQNRNFQNFLTSNFLAKNFFVLWISSMLFRDGAWKKHWAPIHIMIWELLPTPYYSQVVLKHTSYSSIRPFSKRKAYGAQ